MYIGRHAGGRHAGGRHAGIVFSKDNGVTEVSFAYKKKIPLAGPASLLLEYSGSTAQEPQVKTSTNP
ncbi:hypothetical protein ACLB1G_17905 [Oxalobacteraceae bacterium A2-2]